jgi:DNA-binding NtrC family response regulator
MREAQVLVLSPDSSVIRLVQAITEALRHLQVRVCAGIEEACAAVQREPFALVLAHLEARAAPAPLDRLLGGIAASRRPGAALFLSDESNDHLAPALLRAGAVGYLRLPTNPAGLADLLAALMRLDRARNERGPPVLPALAPDIGGDLLEEGFPREMLEQVRRVAPLEMTVLLTGETGTGKTRLARLLHELSPRRDEPFLMVACGALSASLIEAELFGDVRGAGTGASRDCPSKFATVGQGTLLLDEVDALPLPLQGKLLRVVQEWTFTPAGAEQPLPLQSRLIAASNSDLEQEVAAGRFLPELYQRLNGSHFSLPPLRQRRGAIAALAEHFRAQFSRRGRPDLGGLTPEALRALQAYAWPGNIRELRNVLERAVALAPGPLIALSDLPDVIRS